MAIYVNGRELEEHGLLGMSEARRRAGLYTDGLLRILGRSARDELADSRCAIVGEVQELNRALYESGANLEPPADLSREGERENIYLNASILGIRKRDLEPIFQEIIDFSDLGPFIDNQVKNYSAGMYVRLGFSVAININPDILLVDEVLAVGDEAFQAKCLDRISRLQESGKTIVLVTHNADLAEAISDRVLWLERGRVKMLGDPQGVVEAYHEAMSTRPEGSEFGNRDIVIERVQLLDGEGRPAEVFRTGEPLVLRLHYTARRPVEDPVFGFGFYDRLGLMVFGTNTRLREVDIPRVEGNGVVEFTIPSLSMLDGRYYVSVAAHTRDGQVNYHWLDKKYSFEVTSPGRDSGYMTMECRIKIAPGG
ncbi:MAG: ABC transporter ATP-binding protein [Actinomycetota bacterium]